LIVDEVCDSGETLAMATEYSQALGAETVRSAVLSSHSWGASIPDYIGLITDRLILNPWDREILLDGSFQFHPEYVQALAKQGIEPALDMLIEAPRYKIAKGGA
jgi:hypoxanthine phosphoribosyltransferase